MPLEVGRRPNTAIMLFSTQSWTAPIHSADKSHVQSLDVVKAASSWPCHSDTTVYDFST